MKKLLTILSLCTALLLTGCSKGESVSIDGNSATLDNAGITLNFPTDWNLSSVDDIYQNMYDNYYSSNFTSVSEMKSALTEYGLSFYIYADDADNGSDKLSVCNVSSQDITPAEAETDIQLEEYARSVHDSSIFEYLANGSRTGDDSSFSQETYGGQTGYLSHYEIYDVNGEELVFNVGFSEFMFQIDMELYSIQVCYFSESEKEEALSIFDNITAA